MIITGNAEQRKKQEVYLIFKRSLDIATFAFISDLTNSDFYVIVYYIEQDIFMN